MRRVTAGLAGVLVLVCLPAAAQEAPTGYSMSTYHRCAQGDTGRADAFFNQQVAPFLESEQAAGRIAAFGWMQHVEGGEWRRVLYTLGTSLDKC